MWTLSLDLKSVSSASKYEKEQKGSLVWSYGFLRYIPSGLGKTLRGLLFLNGLQTS